MTAAASSTPLLVMAPPPRPAVETAQPRPEVAAEDAEARRLAAAISIGDESAFQVLYARYQRRLLRLALVLARGDEGLANDAVQAAFIVAAKKLRSAESADHLWNWLARVARQQVAKAWRRHAHDVEVVEVAELPDCPANQSDSLLEQCLERAMQSLDADEHEVIEWFYFDGLGHREIAERLGATPKAVSSRLERARTKLRGVIARQLSHET